MQPAPSPTCPPTSTNSGAGAMQTGADGAECAPRNAGPGSRYGSRPTRTGNLRKKMLTERKNGLRCAAPFNETPPGGELKGSQKPLHEVLTKAKTALSWAARFSQKAPRGGKLKRSQKPLHEVLTKAKTALSCAAPFGETPAGTEVRR